MPCLHQCVHVCEACAHSSCCSRVRQSCPVDHEGIGQVVT